MKFLCILPSVRLCLVGKYNERLLVVFDGLRRRTFGPLAEDDEVALDSLKQGSRVSGGSRLGSWLVEEGFAEVVRKQVNDFPPDWPEEWSRQLSSYATFAGVRGAAKLHKQVREAHILVVGLGGIGSHVLQHLVRIGVSKFTLVDPDIVEVANLNRQVLYGRNHVGLPKVKVASEYIRDYWGEKSSVCALEKDFLECTFPRASLRGIDLAIVSADSSPAALRRHVARVLFPIGVSYGFASYSGAVGKLGPLVFERSNGCGCCNWLRIPIEDALTNVCGPGIPRIPASSFGVNALLGAMFVDKWLQDLAGRKAGPIVSEFSLNDGAFKLSHYQRLPSCPVCGVKEE